MGPLGNTCSSSSWCQSHFDFSSTGISFTSLRQEYHPVKTATFTSLQRGKQFKSKSRRKMEPSSFIINQRENVQPKFVLVPVPAKLVYASHAAELFPQNLSPFFNFRGQSQNLEEYISIGSIPKT